MSNTWDILEQCVVQVNPPTTVTSILRPVFFKLDTVAQLFNNLVNKTHKHLQYIYIPQHLPEGRDTIKVIALNQGADVVLGKAVEELHNPAGCHHKETILVLGC